MHNRICHWYFGEKKHSVHDEKQVELGGLPFALFPNKKQCMLLLCTYSRSSDLLALLHKFMKHVKHILDFKIH